MRVSRQGHTIAYNETDSAPVFVSLARFSEHRGAAISRRISPMYVYFISNGNFVKIGVSQRPRGRLGQLQTGSPKALELLAAIPGDPSLETYFHELYADKRSNGEWFRIDEDLRRHLEVLADRWPPTFARKQQRTKKVKRANGVAINPDELNTDELIEILKDGVPRGWRLEQNSNGYWRIRYQVKDEEGEPVTYITDSGKLGYKRGSIYVPAAAVSEM